MKAKKVIKHIICNLIIYSLIFAFVELFSFTFTFSSVNLDFLNLYLVFPLMTAFAIYFILRIVIGIISASKRSDSELSDKVNGLIDYASKKQKILLDVGFWACVLTFIILFSVFISGLFSNTNLQKAEKINKTFNFQSENNVFPDFNVVGAFGKMAFDGTDCLYIENSETLVNDYYSFYAEPPHKVIQKADIDIENYYGTYYLTDENTNQLRISILLRTKNDLIYVIIINETDYFTQENIDNLISQCADILD